MAERIKKTFYRERYILIVFGAMLLIWLLGRGYIAGDVENSIAYLTQFFLDIKAGFVSRTFIGTVLTVFTGNHVTLTSIKTLIFVNEFICAALISLILGNILKTDNSESMSFMAAYLVVSYGSFRFFLTELWPSIFDHYMLTCLLLCVLCLKNKYTKLLIPFICFTGLWINYGFALSCLPVIMILLLYNVLFDEKERKWNTFVFVFSLILCGAAVIYFVFFANRFLKMDLPALHEYITNKMGELEVPTGGFHGIDAYLYGTLDDTTHEVIGNGFVDILIHGYDGLRKEGFSFLIDQSAAVSELIPLLGFAAWWVYIFASDKDQRRRLFAVCNIGLLPVAVLSCIISGDNSRHLSFGLIANAGSLCYTLYKKDPTAEKASAKINGLLRTRPAVRQALLMIPIGYTEYFRMGEWQDMITLAAFAVGILLLVKEKEWLSAAVSVVFCVVDTKYLICCAIPGMVIVLLSDIYGKKAGKLWGVLMAESTAFFACAIYRGVTGKVGISMLKPEYMEVKTGIAAVFALLFGTAAAEMLHRYTTGKGYMVFEGIFTAMAVSACFADIQAGGRATRSYEISIWLLLCAPMAALMSQSSEKMNRKTESLKINKDNMFIMYLIPSIIISGIL